MNGMKVYFAAAIAGFCLDLLFGDPYCLPHPVRWLGTLIGKSERWIWKRFPKTAGGELAGGGVLVLWILFAAGGCSWLFLHLAGKLGTVPWFLAASVMNYYLLAARSLYSESMKVYRPLTEGNTEEARRAVSMIVGRDTERLDEEGITKAAVETVAENTSDGVIAPLLYLLMGGCLLYTSPSPRDA